MFPMRYHPQTASHFIHWISSLPQPSISSSLPPSSCDKKKRLKAPICHYSYYCCLVLFFYLPSISFCLSIVYFPVPSSHFLPLSLTCWMYILYTTGHYWQQYIWVYFKCLQILGFKSIIRGCDLKSPEPRVNHHSLLWILTLSHDHHSLWFGQVCSVKWVLLVHAFNIMSIRWCNDHDYDHDAKHPCELYYWNFPPGINKV